MLSHKELMIMFLFTIIGKFYLRNFTNGEKSQTNQPIIRITDQSMKYLVSQTKNQSANQLIPGTQSLKANVKVPGPPRAFRPSLPC